MSWEMFTPSSRSPKRIVGVRLSIQKSNLAILSQDAYDEMGAPERVELLWDSETKRIGLRPSDDTETAYKVHPIARSFLIGSLIKRYGLEHLRQKRVDLVRDGDVWSFDGGAS